MSPWTCASQLPILTSVAVPPLSQKPQQVLPRVSMKWGQQWCLLGTFIIRGQERMDRRFRQVRGAHPEGQALVSGSRHHRETRSVPSGSVTGGPRCPPDHHRNGRFVTALKDAVKDKSGVFPGASVRGARTQPEGGGVTCPPTGIWRRIR